MSQFTWANPVRTGSDDGPTIAERTHIPDPAAVEHLKRLMAEQKAERARQRQTDAAAKARAELRARLVARAKAARGEDEEPAAAVVKTPARRRRRKAQPATPRVSARPRLDEDAVRALHARHMAGETIKALAAEAGVYSGTLSDHFKRYGLRSQRRKLLVTDDEAAAALAAHAAGQPWREIAREMNVSSKALRHLRRRAGEGVANLRINSSARRIDDDQVRALHARYMDGETQAALAAEVGINPTTLHTRFRALGLRGDGRTRGPAPFTLSSEQLAAVVEGRTAGKLWRVIAADMGCSRRTLALALERAGLDTAELSGKPSAMDESAVVVAAVAAHEAGQPWDVIAADLGWRRKKLVAAVRQAGYDTSSRRPKSALTDDDWEAIVAERKAGMTLEEIAARHGVGRRTLSFYLKQHGYAVKRVTKPVIELDEGLVRRLHARHMAGETLHVLAGEIGVAGVTLVRRFQRLGLTRAGGAQPHWFPDEQLAAAVAAHEAGQSWGAVAAKYGVTPPTLIKAVRRAGYDTGRPTGK